MKYDSDRMDRCVGWGSANCCLYDRTQESSCNHFDHEMLGCAPVYDDKVMCALTKAQFDDVMSEAYKDMPFPQRLLPQDAIDDKVVNGVLYEKKKFYMEGDNNNG